MDRGSNIVQEAVIKTIPKKNKYKKAKWLSEEALQIAEKRREVKGKGEKKRYTHLNAEFQRTARRDKKAFLRDQCKEIEENNRMGKTRDLFKKISDIKGIFHSRMGTIKDRNGAAHNTVFSSVQFFSVQLLSHVRLFVTPWTAAYQASLSITNSQSLLKLMSIESVMPSNHPILCHPLLFLHSVFPSIRVFSNESVLRIRWPKY